MKPSESENEPQKKRKFRDLTGQTFGNLYVVGLDPAHETYPQKFICDCACGNRISVLTYPLTSGLTQNCAQCGRKKQQKVSDTVLKEAYSRINNVWEVGKEVGLCGQSVHERLVKLGIINKMNYFTDDDKFFLLEHYTNYLLEGKLQELADKMGRTKEFICVQARKYGLTDLSRPKKLLANFKPNITPGHWARLGKHPAGMKGKKHTPEVLERLSRINAENQRKISEDPDRRSEITRKMIETKHKKGNLVNQRQKTTWKGGWREIGGKRKYFRSRWEANYARYLQLLKDNGKIADWEHEAKVFWFEGIKRGCVSFLPDFEVKNTDGTVEYHEVKGWMDDRSKTKIRRMSIYFPDVKLEVIGAQWFKNNNRNLTSIISGWET